MPTLIDSSLWIDFTRARSPLALKKFIAQYILSPDAAIAEPIMFEVLRHAMCAEVAPLEAQFQTLPILSTPQDLWQRAATLGQRCRTEGVNAGSIDLLIVVVAMHHRAALITFDADFTRIGKVSGLHVKVLKRP